MNGRASAERDVGRFCVAKQLCLLNASHAMRRLIDTLSNGSDSEANCYRSASHCHFPFGRFIVRLMSTHRAERRAHCASKMRNQTNNCGFGSEFFAGRAERMVMSVRSPSSEVIPLQNTLYRCVGGRCDVLVIGSCLCGRSGQIQKSSGGALFRLRPAQIECERGREREPWKCPFLGKRLP